MQQYYELIRRIARGRGDQRVLDILGRDLQDSPGMTDTEHIPSPGSAGSAEAS
jgi:hypothetical protein